ncbi:hypothetical protein PQZ36_00695 [Flavobacteriaceae bacterium]|nr:hypothetical protein [Flavobacteriaceae bacterium]
MKKGLLTVLLASLVLVGCQNYDDQFDDLNAQISALKSQVDGLGALSGQVSSLSGTISGLQSGIAAAQAAATAAGSSADAATAAVNAIPGVDLSGLTASLATLQAEVDAIEAAIATTATATEVAALQTSLTAVETDLADLLTSNNVYATAITVNSAASMASALALGNKVALMNAAVTITDDATISDTDIQTFINRIKTMNGTFTYDSGSATGFTPTFDEMVAGTVFALTPAGPVSFKKLTSATTVTITTSYATKITSLDMSALASVTSFNTGTVDQLHLSSATNVDLGELARYGASLSIETKKGATLDIAKLDDKSATGLQSDLALTVKGPASLTLSLIEDGTITLEDVASATVSAFYGTLDIKGGVETLTTTDSVFIDLDAAADLVTATLDYKYDWDPNLSTANAAIAAAGYSTSYLEDYSASGSILGTDLKTLTITGDLLDLYLDEANIETLSINANMTDLTMATLTDLTSLTVAGGKIGNITLSDSPNISVANFDHTSNLENKGSATANKSVSFVVTDNLGLTKLHTTGDLIKTFTVTGNDALSELDMTGVKTQGTDTTGATVNIWDNDLTAVKSTDTEDAETATSTTGADGGSADVGSTDDGTSGMDTMKIYLTAIAANTLNTAQVNFDTVSTFDDSETTTTTTTLNTLGSTSVSSTTNDATVLKMTPATANTADGAKSEIAARKGWIVAGSTTTVVFDVGTIGTTGAKIPAEAYTLTGNAGVDAANIASTANKSLANALNLTLDAYVKANSYNTVSIIDYNATQAVATSAGERYTNATLATASTDTSGTATTAGSGGFEFSTGLFDTFTFAVGSNSVTVSLGGAYGGSQTATALANIEAAIQSAWGITYGLSGTASGSAIATLNSAADGVLEVQSLARDSGGWGHAISLTANNDNSAGDSRTNSNIDYMVGVTVDTGDNSMIATAGKTGLIITLTSNDAGTNLNRTTAAIDGSRGASLTALATSYTANTTWTAGTGGNEYAGTQVERTDVITAEASVVAATSNAVAAVKFNRVTWLG